MKYKEQNLPIQFNNHALIQNQLCACPLFQLGRVLMYCQVCSDGRVMSCASHICNNDLPIFRGANYSRLLVSHFLKAFTLEHVTPANLVSHPFKQCLCLLTPFSLCVHICVLFICPLFCGKFCLFLSIVSY